MSVVPVSYAAVDERVVAELGRAPIEGSPWEVSLYAETCSWIATTITEVLPGLQAAASVAADRRSEAVVVLCERAEKVEGRLDQVRARYAAMGSELKTYALAFDGAQGQSWGAHDRASTALALIDTYAGQLRAMARDSATASAATSWREDPTSWPRASTSADLARRGWQARSKIAYDADDLAQVHKAEELDEQWDAVDAAKILMDGAWDTLETAAGTLVTVLKDLHDDGLDDGVRENLSGVGHSLHLDDIRTAVADAVQWVWDHLDDIATVVGLAAVVLCWVPVLGQVLAVASAALSVVVMVKELAEGDIAGAALAALGALTFGAGRATTAAIKVTNTARPAANAGLNLADGVTRAGGASAARAGQSGSSAWREAARSLKPSEIAKDIGTEASAVKAAGITKPSSWVAPSNLVPDGFKVLSNHMVTPGSQLSNTTGVLASANTVTFTVDNVVAVVGAKPYFPGVRGEQP